MRAGAPWRSRDRRRLVFACLPVVTGEDPLAGGEALVVLLERHGEREAATTLEEWLRAHEQ